jgi:hypothetical protein
MCHTLLSFCHRTLDYISALKHSDSKIIQIQLGNEGLNLAKRHQSFAELYP